MSCACDQYVDGKLVKPFYRRDRAVLEEIDPGDALLAMYILDESGWALPSIYVEAARLDRNDYPLNASGRWNP